MGLPGVGDPGELAICVPPVSRSLQRWGPPPTFPFHLCNQKKP